MGPTNVRPAPQLPGPSTGGPGSRRRAVPEICWPEIARSQAHAQTIPPGYRSALPGGDGVLPTTKRRGSARQSPAPRRRRHAPRLAARRLRALPPVARGSKGLRDSAPSARRFANPWRIIVTPSCGRSSNLPHPEPASPALATADRRSVLARVLERPCRPRFPKQYPIPMAHLGHDCPGSP